MPDRYFSAEPINGPTVTLEGNEAHHLLHVMRAQPGLELVVFDGRGGEFAAEVIRCQRSTVEIAVGDRQELERELPFKLTLAVALPKGDRQRWLIEKAVELGVSRLIPLQTARSVGKSTGKAEAGRAKLARYVIEASKQCGRNRLMEIAPSVSWQDFAAQSTTGRRVIAHPGGRPCGEVDWQVNTDDLQIAIGPEGGFADDEVAHAVAAGWETVGLCSRILRIETAALTLVSAFVVGHEVP